MNLAVWLFVYFFLRVVFFSSFLVLAVLCTDSHSGTSKIGEAGRELHLYYCFLQVHLV